MFGKTNLPRWSGDLQSFNEIFGTTNNPWDLTRIPGGSSGGPAAAVAAGFTSFELGTDIGGSVRIPSHCCGMFGLKPSYGVVPQRGYLDSVGGGTTDADINVFGPMARSADDLDLLLSVLAGPEPARQAGVARRAAAGRGTSLARPARRASGSTIREMPDRAGDARRAARAPSTPRRRRRDRSRRSARRSTRSARSTLFIAPHRRCRVASATRDVRRARLAGSHFAWLQRRPRAGRRAGGVGRVVRGLRRAAGAGDVHDRLPAPPGGRLPHPPAARRRRDAAVPLGHLVDRHVRRARPAGRRAAGRAHRRRAARSASRSSRRTCATATRSAPPG